MRLFFLGIGLSVFSAFATAHQVHTHVELSTSLSPEAALVPGQRGRLQLHIATPRWFTGGTRITLPEVPGVLLLQNQAFAANATERRGGESWSIQTWSIDVFATEAGSHRIPPIEVSVSVSEAPGRDHKETLRSETLVVEARIPPELEGLDHWVASPQVSLSDRSDVGAEVPIGEAIARTVTLKATDVMAMMLPPLPSLEHPRLQRYADPPNLVNRSSRGSLRAQREETVNYIATEPGEVVVDGFSVNWWNTQTETLTVLRSEPIAFSITGEIPPEPISRATLVRRGVIALGLLASAVFIALLVRSGLSQRLASLMNRVVAMLGRAWRAARDPVMPGRLNPGGTAAPTADTNSGN